jgi:hypothetical protein
MIVYDLGIAWEWEYDADFIEILTKKVEENNLSVYSINLLNLKKSFSKIEAGEISFRLFLDRASDSNKKFFPLIETLILKGTEFINHPDYSTWAIDKATMHLEFLNNNILVPFTIIIAPFDEEPQLRIKDLALLGRPFIIKPACGGGGVGVVTGAETLQDIIEERKKHSNDKYLLQKKVIPLELDGRRAWFRVFYIYGKIISTWWNDLTHIYEILSLENEEKFKLKKLKTVSKKIQEICKLNFFSTEIAHTESEKFVVVDYVNDMCDMRLKSKHPDGVPDKIVYQIVDEINKFIKK